MTDLLAGMRDENPGGAAGPVDLLDELANRPDAQAWIAEKPGDGIQGTLVDVDVVISDYVDSKTGENTRCPAWVIEDANGDRWRVVGYTASLRNGMNKQHAEPGDTVAILYKGEGEAKARGQKPPKIHRVASIKANRGVSAA